jgi:hypothetical protein
MNMTPCRGLLAALGLLFAGTALAQTDLGGDWRGKLAVDATTSLPVQFTFSKKPDGSWSAVLNSLENENIKNVAASTVSWKDGALKVDVPALSGAYAGSLKDDHFEGQWSQTGSKPIPLALARPPKATKADLEMLTGSWTGQLNGPMKLNVVLEFKPDAKGNLTGTFSVPQQGAQSLPMMNLEVVPGELSFKIPQFGIEYKGAYATSAINGTFKQGPGNVPLNFTKGTVAERSYPLKLNAEQFSALYGNWKGKLGAVESTLHFTVGQANSFAAFMDVMGPKPMTVPVTEASATGKKLVLKVAPLQGEFSGEYSGKTLSGQWTQGGQSTPVTWTKQ